MDQGFVDDFGGFLPIGGAVHDEQTRVGQFLRERPQIAEFGAGGRAAHIVGVFAGAHELQKVLVARHDHRFDVLGRGLAREGADHVIGLKPLELEDGDAIGGEDLRHAFDAGIEIGLKGLVRRAQFQELLGIFGIRESIEGEVVEQFLP